MTLSLLVLIPASHLMKTLNPVKMSFITIFMALSMFLFMYTSTGVSWYPMIFTLLFTGGILIMFMILSSFSPNEDTKKMKMSTLMTSSLILMIYACDTPKLAEWDLAQEIKMYFQNLPSSMATIALIMLYFSVYIKILKKEKNSMKIMLC